MPKKNTMRKNICGIYKIENSITHKIYIGQSRDIRTRWQRHKNELKYSRHPNSDLQVDNDKYGFESFQFSIIEECLPEELNDKEFYWSEYYNVYDSDSGYNVYKRGAQKPIYQYDLNGNFIQVHKNALQAMKNLGTDIRIFPSCIEKKRLTCAGFIWSESKNDPYVQDVVQELKQQSIEKSRKMTIRVKDRLKEVVKVKNGKLVESFKSIVEANHDLQNELNTNKNYSPAICQSCKIGKSVHGYKYYYTDEWSE